MSADLEAVESGEGHAGICGCGCRVVAIDVVVTGWEQEGSATVGCESRASRVQRGGVVGDAVTYGAVVADVDDDLVLPDWEASGAGQQPPERGVGVAQDTSEGGVGRVGPHVDRADPGGGAVGDVEGALGSHDPALPVAVHGVREVAIGRDDARDRSATTGLQVVQSLGRVLQERVRLGGRLLGLDRDQVDPGAVRGLQGDRLDPRHREPAVTTASAGDHRSIGRGDGQVGGVGQDLHGLGGDRAAGVGVQHVASGEGSHVRPPLPGRRCRARRRRRAAVGSCCSRCGRWPGR